MTNTSRDPNRKRDKVVLYSIIAFFLAIGAFICTLYTTVQATSNVVLFPLFKIVSALVSLLLATTCLLVPVMFLVSSYFTFENLVNSNDYPESYGREAVLTLIAGLLLLVAILNAFGSNWLVLVDEIHIEDRVYHLAERHIFDEFTFDRYVLYECPAPGIACSQVYEEREGRSGVESVAQLVAHPETSTISVVVDGETVYTHPPE